MNRKLKEILCNMVSPWEGHTYDLLYELFKKAFILNKTYYRRKNHVGFLREKEEGKEKIFWHLTTQENVETAERLPDLKRCERLPWLKPLLENATDSTVLAWEFLEGDGTPKIYVWLKEHDYIAIMKRTRKDHLILLTAFWIEKANYRRKLLKKYDARNEKANAMRWLNSFYHR